MICKCKCVYLPLFPILLFYNILGFLVVLGLHTYRMSMVKGSADTLNYVYRSGLKMWKILFSVYNLHVHTVLLALFGLCLTHTGL